MGKQIRVPDFRTFYGGERYQITRRTKKSNPRTHKRKQDKRVEVMTEFPGKASWESRCFNRLMCKVEVWVPDRETSASTPGQASLDIPSPARKTVRL